MCIRDRAWLGADSLILYGESYGTQYQQIYAAAHPDHVASLLLDGPVDLGTDVLPFVTESAQAYSDVLAATLSACDRDTLCAGDAPGTTTAAYDKLAAELTRRPRGYAYPEPDGSRGKRKLTVEDLRAAASRASGTSSPWVAALRARWNWARVYCVLTEPAAAARRSSTVSLRLPRDPSGSG